MNRLCFFSLLLVWLLGCKNAEEPMRSMYYWKTVFQPTRWETDFLKSNKIERLYVKYMDIDWEQSIAMPTARTSTSFSGWNKYDSFYHQVYRLGNWVPVIFITNSVFLNQDTTMSRQMAAHVLKKLVVQLYAHDSSNNWSHIREVQFDCDWNKSSREAYFSFLRAFQEVAGALCTVSVTVRLHQYRYPEVTGVPPVKRCMLMMYNVNNPAAPGDKNTIFDSETVKSYINRAEKYPLKLDIAMPAFSWVLCYRAGKLAQILPISHLQLNNKANFMQKDSRRFVLKADMVVAKTYHRVGDIFIREDITADIIKDGSKIAAEMQLHPAHIAFYSLNESQLMRYESAVFDKAFNNSY